MRELGRVFANEWMKLMHRRRLWITVLLGALMVCGLTALSYMDYRDIQKRESPEGQRQQIEQAKQRLKQLEKQSANAGKPLEGMDPQEEMANLKQFIADIEQRLAEEQQLQSGDWRSVVHGWIADAERTMEELARNGNKEAAAYEQGRIMEWKYHLDNGVRPKPYWDKTAYREMDDLINFTSRMFLPLLVVILVADIVSGETTDGTIKLLLIRPVSRAKILLGKWLVGVVASVLLTVAFFAAMFGATVALFGPEGGDQPKMVNVTYTFEKVKDPDPMGSAYTATIAHYDRAAIVPMSTYILNGVVLTALTMISVATLAFLCSTLFRSSMISTAVAFALVIVGEILVQAVGGGKWLFWLFSVHLNLLNNWTGHLSADLGVNISLGTGLAVLGIWAALALIPAFLSFTRRDVLNA